MSNVALLSVETALNTSSFVGGLGVLIRDLFYEASELNYPLSLFSIFYPKQDVQFIENGKVYQKEVLADKSHMKKVFSLELKYGKNRIEADILCFEHGSNCAYFFDPSPSNEDWLRNLKVYGAKNEREIAILSYLFGEAVVSYINQNDLPISVYHLNESDTSLSIPAIKRLNKRSRIIFTTHTALPHGHKSVSEAILQEIYPEFPRHIFEPAKKDGYLNLGRLAVYHSEKINCVSKKHHEITVRELYPEYSEKITYITNGVHESWINPHLAELFNKYMPDWRKDGCVEKAKNIPDRLIFEAHMNAKRDLINEIGRWHTNNEVLGNAEIKEESIIAVYAKRLTEYKRPHASLPIADLPNIVLIVAGPPIGDYGRDFLNQLSEKIERSNNVLYVLNYDTTKAKYLVSGSDIWLNLPFVGQEACGTSVMKASCNGSIVFSTNDGCIPELIEDNRNGFILDNNLVDLRKKVHDFSSNIYDKERHAELMKNAISSSSYFLMRRCFEEYKKMYELSV